MVLERFVRRFVEALSRAFPSVVRSAASSAPKADAHSARTKLEYHFDKDLIDDFLDEPYVVIPKKPGEWYVISPKFIDLSIGWLERTTKSYNIFVLNQYASLLGRVPKDLQDRLGIKSPRLLKVQDGIVHSGKFTESLWQRYRRHLYRRENNERVRIRKGYEFRLLAALIRDGFLPFPAKGVDSNLLRTPEIKFTLRKYQRSAWRQFLKYGAIGVYWPPGAGKTYLGLYAIASLKGRKLVVVPTRILKEQWIERVSKYTKVPQEVTVETYHSYAKVRGQSYMLVIFDECHRLPADTYSRLATLKSQYRIGLSATPYREDGRTEYIFALTGFPVGIDWEELFKLGVVQKPTVTIYLSETLGGKLSKLKQLLGYRVKTLIFCDSVALGKRLSEELEIPFVFGATTRRLKTIRKHLMVIVSRVGDEGLSLEDVERVIEIDFLFGSRRQEAQRIGRLLHAKVRGEHIVLMTDKEFEKYEKRFYALYEKGFRINVLR